VKKPAEKLNTEAFLLDSWAASAINDIVDEEFALERLLDYYSARMIACKKRSRSFWNELRVKYNLDFDNYTWSYETYSKMVMSYLKEKKPFPKDVEAKKSEG